MNFRINLNPKPAFFKLQVTTHWWVACQLLVCSEMLKFLKILILLLITTNINTENCQKSLL